jgi:2-polyprenyl-3-methyl-5-hydroxy-6-metoxy-1,4-benzoquinol methylase
MQTLDDLRADIDELARLGVSESYRAKQLHKIPVAPVVDRVQYILGHCAGKRVLHLGCGWPPGYLHQALERVASLVQGIDIDVPAEPGQTHSHFACWDLDNLAHPEVALPWSKQADIILAPEILEHIGNPRRLLECLRITAKPLLISVPNAHSRVGRHHVTGGVENVHRGHTAWYSYRTLLTLIEMAGYAMQEMAWYNVPKGAQPQEGEGLCMLVR